MPSRSGVIREWLAGFFRDAGGWARSPWVAYPAIALFQLKVLWGAWIYRDLTQGDTASYFQRALLWHQYGQVDIIWSPLYTAFYGWFFGITGDVYAATVLHRVLIAIVVALVVCGQITDRHGTRRHRLVYTSFDATAFRKGESYGFVEREKTRNGEVPNMVPYN